MKNDLLYDRDVFNMDVFPAVESKKNCVAYQVEGVLNNATHFPETWGNNYSHICKNALAKQSRNIDSFVRRYSEYFKQQKRHLFYFKTFSTVIP